MEFIDLAAQQGRIRQKLEQRIKSVLDHGHYIMGPEVGELESDLCSFTGARHCITCSSGSDALLMALLAWDIGDGDAVFLPPFTFFATAEMPSLLGATPIFVDIDPVTFNIAPDLLAKAIAAVNGQDAGIYPLPRAAVKRKLKPKVVIPVDLFGQAANYVDILPIAKKNDLLVLEDAAQSFGGTHNGHHTCALGCDAAATSFFPAKPLGCYGDGGAIFTDDPILAEKLRSIRVHGKGQDKYDNQRIGINGRLDTIQAAILLAKLEIFADEIKERQKVAGWYEQKLGAVSQVTLPRIAQGNTSAWAQYCIILPEGQRQKVADYLKTNEIPTNIYYPKAQHQLAVFEGLGLEPEAMPVAYAASQNILALPFHPYMEKNDVARVATTIKEALA